MAEDDLEDGIVEGDEAPKDKALSDEDLLAEAKEVFELCTIHENLNRAEGMDDLRFSRLGEQWPPEVRQQREGEGRPCLTINKIPSFIRQVVNDARQNKPAITVHPVDSAADPMTAEIMSGLVRQIEYASDADVAYDTATASAVTNGWGYWRINTAYTHDDSFEQEILIEAVPNPFAVYGDPHSTRADSSDWNVAFVVDMMSKTEFEKRFNKAQTKDWEALDGYTSLQAPWIEEDQIRVCEYWKREEVEKEIVALSDGTTVDVDTYQRNLPTTYGPNGVTIVGKPRKVLSWKVTQYLLTGAEVLETTPWAGKYIPIVPVYGDEVNVGGVRFWRSLVRDVKDAQRMFNYWRTVTTELIALAPKAPFIGPKGAFESDMAKWETSNSETHAYMEFDGVVAPQRQVFSGVPAGALQEALNAADDMKAITGIYDASLGARGNETSGRAILLRQKEGDTSTFHFIDNLTRAIRHSGRILIDLIPKVYNEPRIVRITSTDRQSIAVPVNQPLQGQPAQQGGDPIEHIFDMTAGKYDLTVEAGPSFTTKREEAANQMLELIRAYPNSAMVLGDLLAKNLDWPGADEVAERLHALLPAALQQMTGNKGAAPAGPPQPPDVSPQIKQAAADSDAKINDLGAQNQILQLKIAGLQADATIAQQKEQIAGFKAQTERMRVEHEITQPPTIARP